MLLLPQPTNFYQVAKFSSAACSQEPTRVDYLDYGLHFLGVLEKENSHLHKQHSSRHLQLTSSSQVKLRHQHTPQLIVTLFALFPSLPLFSQFI